MLYKNARGRKQGTQFQGNGSDGGTTIKNTNREELSLNPSLEIGKLGRLAAHDVKSNIGIETKMYTVCTL